MYMILSCNYEILTNKCCFYQCCCLNLRNSSLRAMKNNDILAMETDVVRKLCDYILLNAYSVNSTGLYNGKAGFALCLFDVAYKLHDEYLEEQAYELLQEALLSRNEDISFENGLSGIGYVLLYLMRQQYVEADFEEVFGTILNRIVEKATKEQVAVTVCIRMICFFQDLSRHGIYQAERLLYTFLKVATRWIEQLFTRTNNRQVISICENLPYVIAYLQTLCYCLPEIKINSYRNAVDAYTSFYTVEKSVSNLFIGHYLYLLARHEEIADWENVALQNMEAGTANLRQIPLSLAQTIDTLSVLKYYSQTHTKLITQLEKPFFEITAMETLQTNIVNRIGKNCLMSGYQYGIARLLLYWAHRDNPVTLL